LRSNRSTNRSGRSQVDHDVFEGLPVRHWRKASVPISIAPQKEEVAANTGRESLFVELPMPRDAQLLSVMSQALLKAARSGEITKKAPPQPSLEDDKENAEEDDVVGDFDSGFSAKRWAAVPRHLEGPEPEFLAKRRKGLPSAYTAPASQANGAIPMRKTRVRKVDADGNASVLEVLVPEGQKVDGEVVEEEIDVTQTPAPGTVVEGVGVANAEGIIVAGDQALPTPPRRRPPPPKRRPKGPGRGRKKKVAFAPGAEGLNAVRPLSDANRASDGISGSVEGQDGAIHADGDVIIGQDSAPQNGEESSEEDEEGEEGDEDDREEGELSSSPTSVPSPPKEPPLVEQPQEAQAPAEEILRNQDQTTPSEPPGAISPITDPATQRDTSSPPNLPLVSDQAEAADQELTALSTMSNAMDERIMAPQNEEQLFRVEEPSDLVDPASKDIPVVAKIPPEHNPLDGLTAPENGNLDRNFEEPGANASDGEVDLLGSLEQQLDRNESAASTTA
ncbi:MAG: hypothetical protein Q9174_002547, partial [Haloplaca sp. 1 TL-2023]